MSPRTIAIAASILPLVADSIAVAAPAQAGVAEASACELHLWPARRMNSISRSMVDGPSINNWWVVPKDLQNRAQMTAWLDPEVQLDALVSLNIPVLMNQAPANIIRHDEPLDLPAADEAKTRWSNSTAPCYAELAVANVAYQKAHLQGSNLMTSFIYRRFDGSSPTPVKVYHGVESRSLHAFPPKTDADLAAAARDLVLAFKSTARSFVSQRATPAAQP